MSQPLFALIDCNNFFASCEEVFRPEIAGKPVVVLSSNDGCAIARSAAAKALGIPMGAPAFKYKDVFKQHNVIQFSANFELYGDISRRITEVLTSITPRLEVYSIDESFLDISQLDIADYHTWADDLRQTIFKWIGMNVSIGIAPSKTLAKLASERAKKDLSLNGTLVINSTADRLRYLPQTQLEAVWGIGWRYAPKLRAIGIATAADIANLSPIQGRRLLKPVHGERLVRELNGQSCYPLQQLHTDQKMISASRTFGQDTPLQSEVESALANFAAKTSQKLRASNRTANRLSIFLSTDKHKPNFRRWAKEVVLDEPTADTGILIQTATTLFASIYERGVLYHRAGVLLGDFSSGTSLQTDLLGHRSVERFDQSKRRMQAIDAVHARYGLNTMFYATEKIGGSSWQPRKRISSPHYTTDWDDIPNVTIR